VSSQRVAFTTTVSREVWFRFRDLCHSHKVPIERAVEALFREALQKAGIEIQDHSSPAKAGGPMAMKV
jgi:hypothetical protein